MTVIRGGILIALSGASIVGPLAAADPTAAQFRLDIARQPLRTSLAIFARETGLQIARYSDATDGSVALNPVRGVYTAAQALEMLLAGTDYRFRFVDDHTIAVYRASTPHAGESGLGAPGATPAAEAAPNATPVSRPRRLAAFLAALGAAVSGPAWAQDSGGPVAAVPLEEVIVTARRKAERLQDVPLSVTAFTAEKLETLNIEDTTQIAQFTPGLEYSGFSDARSDRGADRQLVFRGLDLASNSGISAGALTFLDGAPVLGGEVIATLDTERVEVLKGPQNVYFGRSTFTGAVNYVTKPIPKEWSGEAEIEEAGYGTQNFQASVGGPLTDLFRLRFTGLSNYTGGDYRNDFDPAEHLGTRNTTFGSGAFEFDPVSTFHIKGYLSYEQDDDGAPAVANVDENSYNCALGGSHANNYYCGALPNAPGLSTYQDTLLTQQYKNWIFYPPDGSDNLDAGDFKERYGLQRHLLSTDIHLDYTLDNGVNFSELSAYHNDHDSNVGDGVLRSLATYAVIPPESTTLFQYGFNQQFTDLSNELRVNSAQNQRLRWTAGATQIHVVQLTEITAAFTFAGVTIPYAPTYDSIQTTDTYGVFAGAYFDIVDGLTVSAEGRYQRDTENQGAATANPRLFLSKLYQSFQPRVSLDWKVTPNLSPYISYASGTRPGGFNAVLVGQPASVVSQITAQTGLSSPAYNEEKLTTTEIGVKGSAFDHHLSGSIDAYYGNLTNGQISQTINYNPPGGGTIGVDLVSNLGKVQIDGLELEGGWQVFPRLTVTGTFALNQTNILAYPCTPCLATIGTENVEGHSLPLAPQVSGSLALDYNQPLAANWSGFFHLDDAYRGKRWQDFENIAYIRPADYVNLRLGAKTGNLTLEGFVTNLTNNLTVTGAQRLNDTVDGSLQFRVGLPDKRNFGGRLLYRF